MPVVISGEFGVEIHEVAYGIHFCSDRADSNLVEINCEAIKSGKNDEDPEEWFKQAGSGTLLLNNIDRLDLEYQDVLSALISMADARWLALFGEHIKPRPRIIVTTNRDLSELTSVGEFSQQLLGELNFLQICVPALRDRREDIRPFVEHYLQKHSQSRNQKISPKAMSVLVEHDWSGNIVELDQVLARIVIGCDKQDIALSDLKYSVPSIVQRQCMASSHPKDLPKSGEMILRQEIVRERIPKTIAPINHNSSADLPTKVLAGVLDDQHPCIERATKFIAGNYQNEITLTELAGASCVSASHLCFLFRTKLNTTFKALLAEVRIHKAKELLVQNPNMPITLVSIEVGYCDLSHFERVFRRLVGSNPRKFRQGFKEKSAVQKTLVAV